MKTIRQTGSDRRLSLLQAALDLFSTQGYAGTTTKAIAERSGVTEALLFRHFHSKQELLGAVVERFGPRPLFSPPLPDIHTLPPHAALELMFTRYLDTIWENRAFMLMMFTTPKREQAVFEAIWTEFGKQAMYLYTMLQERSDRGELKPGIAAAATDVVAAAMGGFFHRVLSDTPDNWEATRNAYVANLLQILLGGIQDEKK